MTTSNILRVKRTVAAMLSSLALLAVANASTTEVDTDRWSFDVYLDSKRVGTHVYEIVNDNGQERVSSEANFDYKIFFVTAYRYEHSNAELWEGDCLVQISADTNANGKRFSVRGEQGNSKFIVDDGSKTVGLPECVQSFAYWDSDFLKESRLLNAQTGEYVDVEVAEIGKETLEVKGEAVDAVVYRLTAAGVDLKLWYSKNDRWLALESVAKGGRLLRYELS